MGLVSDFNRGGVFVECSQWCLSDRDGKFKENKRARAMVKKNLYCARHSGHSFVFFITSFGNKVFATFTAVGVLLAAENPYDLSIKICAKPG